MTGGTGLALPAAADWPRPPPRIPDVHLTKWSYRADFAAYPVLIASALVLALPHAGQAASALTALAVGWAAWTGIEYSLHRWVLHRVPPFKRMHDEHHARPAEFIGTPTWFSVMLFLAAWAALAAELPHPTAAGAAAGLMAGYLCYTLIHDAVHHRRAAPGTWLYRAKRRHALHHRPGAHGHYGVSTGFWDRVFGTSTSQ